MLAIKSLVKRRPNLPGADKLAQKILGEHFEISLVWAGTGKTVLAYPLDPKLGEIFIDPTQAKAAGFSLPYLFIHGLLHLKGHRHGSKMNSAEQKILAWYQKKYGSLAHHRSRFGHRHAAVSRLSSRQREKATRGRRSN